MSKDVRMCYWLDLVPGACSVDDTVELEWEDARKVGGCPADGRTNSAFLVCGCGFVWGTCNHITHIKLDPNVVFYQLNIPSILVGFPSPCQAIMCKCAKLSWNLKESNYLCLSTGIYFCENLVIGLPTKYCTKSQRVSLTKHSIQYVEKVISSIHKFDCLQTKLTNEDLHVPLKCHAKLCAVVS